tara:strand:- start:16589 stop:16873 length:285 start_codon:yes stop_codon:yes gene_type:complete
MPTVCNELNWWIETNGSTHTTPNERLVPNRPLLARGKVYLDSKSGVIIAINNAPAHPELMSRQLLDVLHTRFPGTRWWIKDPAPVVQPNTSAAS